jgi:uncharacterized membrane protein
MRKLLARASFCCLLFVSAALHADERILSFASRITVNPDATMTVAETITVRAQGVDIKRGVYRDFPTRYKDRLGHAYNVGFTVIGVSRDGQPEDYHLDKIGRGIRVYMGKSDVYLTPGEYTYQLIYRTNRQLGFFETHDELYWNVTGNEWKFPIDHAEAVVQLPANIPHSEISIEGYTGPTGSKAQNYSASVDPEPHIETNRGLAAREGLTLVVTWPKGYVQQPSATDEFAYLMRDNRHLKPIVAGVLLLLGYYLVAWTKVGRDPEAGIVIPHYEPPKGYSPASIRFIEQMGYDKKCFATALLSLAAKGYIKLIEKKKRSFVVERDDRNCNDLVAGESRLLQKLLGAGKRIELKQSNHKTIRKALNAHKLSLRADYERLYFTTNRGFIIIGAVATLLIQVISVLMLPQAGNLPGAAFMLVWLTGWSAGVFALVTAAIVAWKQVDGVLTLIGALVTTGFALPFVLAELMGLFMLSQVTSVGNVIGFLICISLNVLFYQLMKAPTRMGRRLLDKIEGFRSFLDIAEKDELNFRHPEGKTPELFEAYLPYALALDVEQNWAEQFSEILAKTQVEGGSYHPRWYRGSHWNPNDIGSTAASFSSSLSSAVSSASTAPGSSSGSGGGGSSGGGGGGGGGGGW